MKYPQMEQLETDRLILRKLSMDDLYDYYERIGSDGDLTRYMLWDPHQHIGESLETVQNTLDRYESGNCYRWAIARKEDNGLIGMAELLRFDEEAQSCSFVYMIAKAWWGQGYATEAMRAVFAFAFDKMGIVQITADHMAGNAASGAVMRKLGMTHVGTEVGKYNKQGRTVDAECYAIVREQTDRLTANEYQRRAMLTRNSAMTRHDSLINGVMGLCGESGEAIDLVKKHLAQGHPLDREKLIRELGDVAWYLAETAWALDVSLESVLQANLDKLAARYPAGFDTARSQNRD